MKTDITHIKKDKPDEALRNQGIGVQLHGTLSKHMRGTGRCAHAFSSGNHRQREGKSGLQGCRVSPGLLDLAKPIDALTDRLERLKAGIRARVEHPLRVLKRQFGHVKVRYRGLTKNTAQLHTLFALANLWTNSRLSCPCWTRTDPCAGGTRS